MNKGKTAAARFAAWVLSLALLVSFAGVPVLASIPGEDDVDISATETVEELSLEEETDTEETENGEQTVTEPEKNVETEVPSTSETLGEATAQDLESFFGLEDDIMPLDALVGTVYNFSDDYTLAQQGPVWYYTYAINGSWDLIEYTATNDGRWNEGTYGTRIFFNGPMPCANSSNVPADPVMVWVAPEDGLVEISAGAFSQGSVSSTGGMIKMETNTADRDGTLLTVWHESQQVWPDAGAVVNTQYRRAASAGVEFEPFRVYVQEGERLMFRANMNQNRNNDRTLWNPVVEYIQNDSPIMGDLAVSNAEGKLSFTLENYTGAIDASNIRMYVSLDDGASTPVAVQSAGIEAGVVTVNYDRVLPASAGSTSKAQLTCVVSLADGEQGRVSTFDVDDSGLTSTVSVSVVGEGDADKEGDNLVNLGADFTVEFEARLGYEVEKILLDGAEVPTTGYSDTSYTLTGVTQDHTIEIHFTAKLLGGGTTYYIANNGNDSNDGMSEVTPWQSLDKVNATTFLPGDNILFKAKDTWIGSLWPKGDGTEDAPITLGMYGGDATKGEYPIFNNAGVVLHSKGRASEVLNPTVLLSNQSYWIIQHLEVSNTYNPAAAYNVGIQIHHTGENGASRGITVRENYVHDVLSNTGWKFHGGIQFTASRKWIDAEIKDLAAITANNAAGDIGFHGITVVDNHVKNVAKEGIRTSAEEEGAIFRTTVKSSNLVIRGNYIEDVWGDGIVPADFRGVVVEHNIVKNHCNYDAGSVNYAGMWGWYTKDGVYRYNEVFGGEYGYNDGEALDFDNGNTNVTYEYNFTHHNKGGFILYMSDSMPTNTIRYNISVNDGRLTSTGYSQELFHGGPGPSAVYNNTFYIGRGHSVDGVFSNASASNFKNNIVLVDGSVKYFAGNAPKSTNNTNNIFYPQSIMAVNGLPDEVLENNILQHPQLAAPQAFVDLYGYDATNRTQEYDLIDWYGWGNQPTGAEFVSALRERAGYFKITEDSPARGNGTWVTGHATEDFFGNPVDSSVLTAPDIGAHQYTADPGPVEDPAITGVIAETLRVSTMGLSMVEGESQLIESTITPENTYDTGVIWESLDSTVATVSPAGIVRAVAPGATTLTATSASNPALVKRVAVVVSEYNDDMEGEHFVAHKDSTMYRLNSNNTSDRATADAIHAKMDNDKGVNDSDWKTWRRGITGFAIDANDIPGEYEAVYFEFYLLQNGNPSTATLRFSHYEDNWNPTTILWDDIGDDDPVNILGTMTLNNAEGGLYRLDITEYMESLTPTQLADFSIVVESTTNAHNKGAHSLASSKNTTYTKPNIFYVTDSEPDPVKSVESPEIFTMEGVAPVLPATVRVEYKDGNVVDAVVDWEPIDPSAYATAGEDFAVGGYLNDVNKPVLATVRVVGDRPVKLAETNISTPAGVAPVLPGVIDVEMESGDKSQAAVVWESISRSDYATPGQFKVAGVVENYTGEYHATVTVTDAVPDLDKLANPQVAALAGYAPVLPTTVEVPYTDGATYKIAAIWGTVNPADYAAPGSFGVNGVLENGVHVTADVTVYTFEAVEEISLTNYRGKYPSLPETVPVKVQGGQTIAFTADWNIVPAGSYNGAANFTVNGTLAGTNIAIKANITQLAAPDYYEEALAVTEDSYIQVILSDSVHGDKHRVEIKSHPTDGEQNREGLLKFTLDAARLDELTSLTLRLPVAELGQKNGEYFDEYTLALYAHTVNWNEGSSYDGVSQGGDRKELPLGTVRITPADIGGYVDVDVTPALAMVRADDTLSFLLAVENHPVGSEDGVYGGVTLYSREAAAANEAGCPGAAQLLVNNDYINGVETVSLRHRVGSTLPFSLPGAVNVRYLSGKTGLMPVVWDFDSANLQKPGSHKIAGTLGGMRTEATLTVLAPYSLKDGETVLKYEGKGSLTLNIDADIDDFAAISIDGKVLTLGSDYTLRSGSVIVTLLESTLTSLTEGSHSIVVTFADGSLAIRLDVSGATDGGGDNGNNGNNGGNNGGGGSGGSSEIKKTGDAANGSWLWVALFAGVALLALGAVQIVKRRKSTKA